MTSREQFEAWMKSLSGYPFAGQFANLMWAAWQAAHATPAEDADVPLGVYDFDVKLGEQMYVDNSMQYRNGTVTLTIKRRKPREALAHNGTGE